MAFKFVAFFACIAMASAGYVSQVATPLAAVAQPVLAKTEEYDPNPQYSFGYDVQDAISGDNKNQVESRNGDVVQGQYSLNDADGYRRIVDYSADPLNGFNAVVRREPLGAAVAVKTVAAAPTLIKAAPSQLAYAAAPRLIQTPTLIKSAPAQLAYAAPTQTLYRSAPAPLAYAAAPSLIHGAPTLSYAAAAPALLRSQTLIKSSPVVSYSSAPTLLKSYAAAPALTYAAGGSTLVKTSFASPIVSYAY